MRRGVYFRICDFGGEGRTFVFGRCRIKRVPGKCQRGLSGAAAVKLCKKF